MTEDKNYWRDRRGDDARLDWRNGAGSWIDEYVESVNHPHRKYILQALHVVGPFTSLLEVGCNTGPNLVRIHEEFPGVKLAGIDVNEDAIKRASEVLPSASFEVASVENIPYGRNSFDIILADAVLMYVPPEEFRQVIEEIERVAAVGVVFCEWDSPSVSGVEKSLHWARDYARLLRRYDFAVSRNKITESMWPSKNWIDNGYIYVATRNERRYKKSYAA